jgi:hypothetical protein
MGRDNINEILNSLDGMQPARPHASLYAKIEQRIATGYAAAKTVPLSRVSLAAACILLLVVINVVMATQHKPHQSPVQQKDATQQVAEYYGLTDNMGGL